MIHVRRCIWTTFGVFVVSAMTAMQLISYYITIIENGYIMNKAFAHYFLLLVGGRLFTQNIQWFFLNLDAFAFTQQTLLIWLQTHTYMSITLNAHEQYTFDVFLLMSRFCVWVFLQRHCRVVVIVKFENLLLNKYNIG